MSGEERPAKTRRIFHATCVTHPGVPGFCNLEVLRTDDGDLILRPHATGACVVMIDETEARDLHTWLGQVLAGGSDD